MSRVSVRKLRHWKEADAGWFRDLDNQCFPKDTSFYNTEDYHWWVVYEGDNPVAYAGAMVKSRTGDDKQIVRVDFTRCGVLPGHRGRGYQTRLIRARIAWCRRVKARRIETYTSLDNTQSRNNLLAAGFRSRRRGCWFRYRLDLEIR